MRLKGISFFSHTWVRKLFGWPAIKKEALMSVGVSVWLLHLSVSASFRLCSSASELLFVRLCLSASDLSFSPVKSPSVHLTRAYLSVCLSVCLPACLAGWLAGCLSVCLSVCLSESLCVLLPTTVSLIASLLPCVYLSVPVAPYPSSCRIFVGGSVRRSVCK